MSISCYKLKSQYMVKLLINPTLQLNFNLIKNIYLNYVYH
jgi:hypothetical protein